jgi:hypothetical protein
MFLLYFLINDTSSALQQSFADMGKGSCRANVDMQLRSNISLRYAVVEVLLSSRAIAIDDIKQRLRMPASERH